MYLDVYLRAATCGPRIGPFFPDGPRFFRVVRNRIAAGELKGQQEDWGSWAARVSAAEIRALVDEWYGERRFADAYNAELLEELRTFVASLDENEPYANVASEL